MDDNLLEAWNNVWVTAATAPGMGIPAWLYRRCLYLLDAESTPDSADTMGRIRHDLMRQTGIRIPGRLMRAIALTYTDMNHYRRNRIYNFTEAQMRPAEGDNQIQPVAPIRRGDGEIGEGSASVSTEEANALIAQDPPSTPAAAATSEADRVVQEERDRLEAAEILLSIYNQVPQAASLTVDLELTEETGTANHGDDAPTQYHGEASRPGDDHDVGVDHDANALRRQNYPQQGLLLGMEQHASPSTERERADVQARLRGLLRDINAAEIIGTPLEGDHVQPTDQYLSGVDQHPLLRDERGLINHASPDEFQRRPQFQPPSRQASPPQPNKPRDNFDFRGEDPDLHYYSGPSGLNSVNSPLRHFQPNPNPPPPPRRRYEDVLAAASRAQAGPHARSRGPKAATTNASRSQGLPQGRTPASRRPRASRKPAAIGVPERVTRSTAAKQKTAKDNDAKKTQADGKHPDDATGQDTNNTAEAAQSKDKAPTKDKAPVKDKAPAKDKEQGKAEASTSSETQMQGPENRSTPNIPRRLILRPPTIRNPRRLILNPPKAPTETKKPAGKSGKRARDDEPQEEGDADKKDVDDGKKKLPAKKRRTRK